MATFVLLHGGGSTAWDWHLVAPFLEGAGHDAVAVDLPIEDANAGLKQYLAVIAAAVPAARHIIVVGHSLGGFIAPLACEHLDAEGLAYLAGMIPLPGESFADWWANTGHDLESIDDDPEVLYFNGVPDALAREARARERDQQGGWMSGPWPADRHPAVPTLAILCREDNLFPASFMRRQVRERLGIEPVEIDGGHYAALSHPDAVAAALVGFAGQLAGRP
ncbi:alpha/beta hydrolase [Arthrobacter sp. MSA 4-2]|uniref:alpha/beta fold hydrolase n=1 Tax=Arthrobacter sp. MSA 4-2 TaxID=2794349 RepID=UPI0018E908F1|nr:alpha/beta hydrolase [Arthrobacter sp. MSA 4-2]MBJ2122304.1 alpha/beta hydrolase [Arthrobacter sp. MSA 4-2]